MNRKDRIIGAPHTAPDTVLFTYTVHTYQRMFCRHCLSQNSQTDLLRTTYAILGLHWRPGEKSNFWTAAPCHQRKLPVGHKTRCYSHTRNQMKSHLMAKQCWWRLQEYSKYSPVCSPIVTKLLTCSPIEAWLWMTTAVVTSWRMTSTLLLKQKKNNDDNTKKNNNKWQC